MGSHHGEDEININERMERFVERDKISEEEKKNIEKESTEISEETLTQKFAELDHLRAKQPDGRLPPLKLTPKDSGDIRFSVGTSMDKKRVVINFGKQIRWVGMTRNQAIDVGRALIKAAKETIE